MDTKSLVLTLIALKGWNATKVVKYLGGFVYDYAKAAEGLAKTLNDEEKAAFKAKLPKVKAAIELNQKREYRSSRFLVPASLGSSTKPMILVSICSTKGMFGY
jgi:hypothetical protein